MKNLLFVFLIASFVLMDCSTQTQFLSKESRWLIFRKVNKKYTKTGKIKTTNQISFIGKNIFIASDSTFWIDPETNKRHSIATSTIKEIEFSGNSGQNAAAGAAIGVIGGAFLGFIIGVVEDSKKITLNPFSSNPEPGSGIKNAVIIGAAVGMGAGIIAGVGGSPNEKFVLDFPER
jgi:hypothetical protein